MRQVIKWVALVGLALGITAVLITVTTVWRGELTVGQLRETVGFSEWNRESQADKVQPIVSHLEDPFLAQKIVTIKSFDEKSVVLTDTNSNEVLTYSLDEDFLIIRQNDENSSQGPNHGIEKFSMSVLREEDLGQDARLVPIYIRPKPALPEKRVLGLYI